MLAEEVHRLVEQHEDITFRLLGVDKLVLVCTTETRQAYRELEIHSCLLCEKCRCRIQQFIAVKQFPFVQNILNGFGHGYLRHTSSLHTKPHHATNQILVKRINLREIRRLTLPGKEIGLALAKAQVEHIARHFLGSAFYPIIRAAVIGIGYVSPQPSTKVHGYYFLVGAVGNIYIFHVYIHLWLQIAQSLGYLTLGIVRYILTKYLQG